MKPIIVITVSYAWSQEQFVKYCEIKKSELGRDYHLLFFHDTRADKNTVQLIESKHTFMSRWKFRLTWTIFTLISLSIWAIIIHYSCN
jgi:hypothetical protein